MKKGFSQEGLKLLACLTMLCDHIGHVLIPYTGNAALYYLLRIIGRLAFPLYVFLLVEGFVHTRNHTRYFLRLLTGVVLAELPYDWMLHGGFSWASQSVMVTLLLGFLALTVMEKCGSIYWKPVAALPFLILAELACCDYGWQGVLLVVLFAVSREYYARNIIRFGGMLVIFHTMPSVLLPLGNMGIPLQALGALSILFIASYDGRKLTDSRPVQWAFYLFYPVHMLILKALEWLLYGGYSL